MAKRVEILIGIQGSGKSTYANMALIEQRNNNESVEVYSADHFFLELTTGEYKFDAKKLGQAHAACLKGFLESVMSGYEGPLGNKRIIVDNTNANLVDMAPYVAIASAFDWDVQCILFYVDVVDVYRSADRCIHNVPKRTVSNTYWAIRETVERWPKRWKQLKKINAFPSE